MRRWETGKGFGSIALGHPAVSKLADGLQDADSAMSKISEALSKLSDSLQNSSTTIESVVDSMVAVSQDQHARLNLPAITPRVVTLRTSNSPLIHDGPPLTMSSAPQLSHLIDKSQDDANG